MWCDFGANLVQHFVQRYLRYRTKTHDKATISHDISRYSRYGTAFLKLQEVSSYFYRFYIQKALLRQGFLCFIADSRGRLSLQEYRAVQFVKNPAVLFQFWSFYDIIYSNQHITQILLLRFTLSVGIIKSQQNNRKGETK